MIEINLKDKNEVEAFIKAAIDFLIFQRITSKNETEALAVLDLGQLLVDFKKTYREGRMQRVPEAEVLKAWDKIQTDFLKLEELICGK
jgi:hypothetical protein